MVSNIDSGNVEEMSFGVDRKSQSMHNTWSSKEKKWANIHSEVWGKEHSGTRQILLNVIPRIPHTQNMLITLTFSEYRTLKNTQFSLHRCMWSLHTFQLSVQICSLVIFLVYLMVVSCSTFLKVQASKSSITRVTRTKAAKTILMRFSTVWPRWCEAGDSE